MDKVWAHMPKIWHKLRGLAKVCSTEPRLAMVIMDVHMEHADLIAEGDLHGLSYGRWAHHRAHRMVAQIIFIGHGVKIVCEDDPT